MRLAPIIKPLAVVALSVITTLAAAEMPSGNAVAKEIGAIRGAIAIPEAPKTPPKQIKLVKVCVFDPIGAHGAFFNAAKDVRLETMKWGYDLELVPYTSEKIATEDFKAGQCQAALISGLRARLFNKFAGTIDSIGGLVSEQQVRLMMEVLASPKISGKMRAGQFEVLAAVPIGGAYIFTNDRTVSSLTRAAGKRVAVLDYDPVQSRMVAEVGASPVSVDITNVGGKFNNGTVDIVPMPLGAYLPLELYKGLGSKGGIINYPLAWPTVQIIVRTADFPPEIGIATRGAVFANFDLIMKYVRQFEADVPKHYFVEIPAADKQQYEAMMQAARVRLRDEGYYDGEMLALQRKIRCRLDAARSECSEKVE